MKERMKRVRKMLLTAAVSLLGAAFILGSSGQSVWAAGASGKYGITDAGSADAQKVISAIESGSLDGMEIDTFEIPKSELNDESGNDLSGYDLRMVIQSYLNKSLEEKYSGHYVRVIMPSGTYMLDSYIQLPSNVIFDCRGYESKEVVSEEKDETLEDESPVDESPADESPADESPADETPADELSAAELNVSDENQPELSTAEEYVTEESSLEDNQVEESQVQESAADECQLEESMTEENAEAEDELFAAEEVKTGGATTAAVSDDHDATGVVFKPMSGANGNVLRDGSNGDGSKGYDYYKNIVVLGGTYDGNGCKGCNIRFGHCSNVRLIGANVTNNVGAHHLELGGVNKILVSDCVFEGSSGTTSLEAVQLDVTHRDSDNFAGFDANDDLATINATIENCNFKNVARAVGSHHSVLGSYYSGEVIRNNYMENISDIGIICSYFKNSQVYNNYMKNVATGIKITSMIPEQFYQPNTKANRFSKVETMNANLKVYNNTIGLDVTKNGGSNSFVWAIRVGGEALSAADAKNKNTDLTQKGTTGYPSSPAAMPAGTYYMTNVNIYNNSIAVSNGTTKNVSYGIYMNYVNKSNVYNNVINLGGKNKDGAAGISIKESDYNSVYGNTISGLTYKTTDGIYVGNNSIYNKINTNTIKSPTRYGIQMNGSSGTVKSNSLYKDTITGAGKVGINLTKANVSTINCCTITGCKGNAINMSSSSYATSITKNVIKSNKGIAINVGDSRANAIYGNTMSGNTKNIIYQKKGLSFKCANVTMKVKQTKTLGINSGAAKGTVTWKTSNKAVATVKNGKVTAKKKGTVKISATKNGITQVCVITVK